MESPKALPSFTAQRLHPLALRRNRTNPPGRRITPSANPTYVWLRQVVNGVVFFDRGMADRFR